MSGQRTLGINGLGRIGKLTLWHHLGRDEFDRIVINVGRPVGTSLDSVVQYIAKDSTYGPVQRVLYGQSGVLDMQRRRRGQGPDQRLRQGAGRAARAPRPQGHPVARPRVALVVECTGNFRDRTPRRTPRGAPCAVISRAARRP